MSERVKEGVSVLKQLRDAGVRENGYGFLELKMRISEWVKTGQPWSGTIIFECCDRIGIVEMPRYNNKALGMQFNTVKRSD